MLHYYKESIKEISLPKQFTFPFHYTPHPLCVKAAEELQEYLSQQKEWEQELTKGKMFGVLVVETSEKRIGYLTAFSGNLNGKNNIEGFVPPIYDLLNPAGFFRIEENKISNINHKIKELINNDEYLKLTEQYKAHKEESEKEIAKQKEFLKEQKQLRSEKRKKALSQEEETLLIKESQFEKAEFHRLKLKWKEQIETSLKEIEQYEKEIIHLKNERKRRSAQLQRKLFNEFKLLNANGEVKELCQIFDETVKKTPPAGSGECAAPKLLQYAYLKQLKPIAMAEFWWGNSPKTEIRHHKHFYPSCTNKCKPILSHMLIGLDVEPNPLSIDYHKDTDIPIVYEDEWLTIVNKPAGMLSVPGKEEKESVYSKMKKRYPNATGPLIVHRLDMDTSGLLIITKTKEVHKMLQEDFRAKRIHKCYVALLSKEIKEERGTINLKLCANPENRPLQMVSEEYGKEATTHYQVIDRKKGKTRILLYPLTGRTHQLRVHTAHHEGLNAPILGDPLYGKKEERLYLHAQSIELTHPITKEKMKIEVKAPF